MALDRDLLVSDNAEQDAEHDAIDEVHGLTSEVLADGATPCASATDQGTVIGRPWKLWKADCLEAVAEICTKLCGDETNDGEAAYWMLFYPFVPALSCAGCKCVCHCVFPQEVKCGLFARLADKLPIGGHQRVDFVCPAAQNRGLHYETLMGLGFGLFALFGGLVVDVAVDVHIDVDSHRMGLLFHDVAEQSGTAGQEGDTAHHTKGKAEVCQHRTTNTGAV
ncbi:unannotated protein [freshwater metagenome]|uniref:Unannotated protein n=1 Tax=freshwater metagenome TaxID=449393 RepID=A0A6J6H3C2_9ZZZZ